MNQLPCWHLLNPPLTVPWMADHGVSKVWVLADNPGAEGFYGACGFQRDEPQPVEMSRRTV